MDGKVNLGTTVEENKDGLSLTDEEDDEYEDEHALPELHGTLSKWTNYIHGWQSRFFALKEGTLSYYKSENETRFGCRGAVSLVKAVIQPHEFDECRFDVSVNDCLWYLRANDPEERQRWIDGLQVHKQAESGYGSENSLRRHDSMLSLTSGASMSNASASSFKRGRGLKEKLLEMETFRDILCRQVDTLQSYFDACSSVIAHKTVHDLEDDIDDVDDFDTPSDGHQKGDKHTFVSNAPRQDDIVNILQQHGAHAIDFKGEAFTFKATTAGILATLSHCIELMAQREDAWKKRLEREVEKKRRLEEAYRHMSKERSKPVHVFGGPDYEEGPHSCLNEEEFFDAVDASLDKLDREQEERLSSSLKKTVEPTIHEKPPNTSLDPAHPLYDEIEQKVTDHIKHADLTLRNTCEDVWQLVTEDGDMKIYRREQEVDGIVVDPIKAVHTVKIERVYQGHLANADLTGSAVNKDIWTLVAEDGGTKIYKQEKLVNGVAVDPIMAVHVVKGISGHEFCHYFWDPSIRMEWEGMIDSCDVVEWLSSDTFVAYQLHKRVWPTTQRDSLFWSTMRHAESEDGEGPDYWVVVNFTCDHKDDPVNSKCVRIIINVACICETIVDPPPNKNEPIGRDNIQTRIHYTANINPGGWAPASVIRAISKRECPKFLRNFTAYVEGKTKNKPIMF